MISILAIIWIALMVLSLMLLMIGLPGNWVIIGLAVGWTFIVPAAFTWQFFALLIGLGIIGEIMEFFAGHFGAKRFGGSTKGSIGGIIGAIIGGIMCAPIFFGFGALPGALAGGFLGCFLVEKLRRMDTFAALRSAFGSTVGRFGGFLVKLGIGLIMIRLAAPTIWGAL